MNVDDKYDLTNGHSIEWGEATWDSNEISIRNRYDNVITGRFNKAGSGEIPWEDFKHMIKQSIIRKHFNNTELIDILKEIANSL